MVADELVTHALLRRGLLNKDGKVKGKCTALWEGILPGRQKGDDKGKNMTAASKNREETMQVALRGRGGAGSGGC